MSFEPEPMSMLDRRGLGFLSVTLLHPVLGLFGGNLLAYVGVAQCLYALPIVAVCAATRHVYAMQGAMSAMVIAALVNLSCFGLLLLFAHH